MLSSQTGLVGGTERAMRWMLTDRRRGVTYTVTPRQHTLWHRDTYQSTSVWSLILFRRHHQRQCCRPGKVPN